jgi:protein-S-isoprenylcysteine O-methyltransferase Ste14
MKRQTVDHITLTIMTLSFVFNLILFNIKPPAVKKWLVVGCVILAAGALLFIVSIITLRRQGVSRVIDTGIYGTVRHPMYLGAMLMFCSHVFFGQNWMVATSTTISIVGCYLLMLSGDRRNIEKFGEDYLRYMKRVPRMNFFPSIARLVHKAE